MLPDVEEWGNINDSFLIADLDCQVDGQRFECTTLDRDGHEIEHGSVLGTILSTQKLTVYRTEHEDFGDNGSCTTSWANTLTWVDWLPENVSALYSSEARAE
jgi:hypothetical protein